MMGWCVSGLKGLPKGKEVSRGLSCDCESGRRCKGRRNTTRMIEEMSYLPCLLSLNGRVGRFPCRNHR